MISKTTYIPKEKLPKKDPAAEIKSSKFKSNRAPSYRAVIYGNNHNAQVLTTGIPNQVLMVD